MPKIYFTVTGNREWGTEFQSPVTSHQSPVKTVNREHSPPFPPLPLS
ncbi:hypothetical protein CKA32_001501 [Geitlerinema sp. FC II]|nr:hypothetical protein CKA32_001501 [Geitlerinema sp. FC II]